jgi:hypothetical protein
MSKKNIEFKEKALVLISSLCEFYACKNTKTDVNTGKFIETEDLKFVNQLYRLSHAASDSTCEHQDWENELQELYIKFQEEGIV